MPLSVPVSLGMSSLSEYMPLLLVYLTLQHDVLSGLKFGPTWAFYVLGWNESLVVFAGVSVAGLALYESTERLPIC